LVSTSYSLVYITGIANSTKEKHNGTIQPREMAKVARLAKEQFKTPIDNPNLPREGNFGKLCF